MTGMTLRELPVRMRPDDQITRLGCRNVPDEVLLATILRTGVRGTNALDLARGLLQRRVSPAEDVRYPASFLYHDFARRGP